jgi:uncharacterized repeat protein (TIGR04138 family)
MNTSIIKFYISLLEGGNSRYPLEFYSFLFDIIQQEALIHKTITNNQDDGIHFSPQKICILVSSRLKQDFGCLAWLVLEEWGVHGALDIGKGVFDLAGGGCLKLNGTETMEDFEKAGLLQC